MEIHPGQNVEMKTLMDTDKQVGDKRVCGWMDECMKGRFQAIHS